MEEKHYLLPYKEGSSRGKGSTKNALNGPGGETLSTAFGIEITRKDIHTLIGLNWLNDQVKILV